MEAGSDIIETNTFSGTSIAQADYGTENLVSSEIVCLNRKCFLFLKVIFSINVQKD